MDWDYNKNINTKLFQMDLKGGINMNDNLKMVIGGTK